jgi:hypothetical protein
MRLTDQFNYFLAWMLSLFGQNTAKSIVMCIRLHVGSIIYLKLIITTR